MSDHRKRLLCSTAVAAALGLGAAVLAIEGERASLLLPAFVLPAAACAPCAPRGACGPCDPCAPCAACGPCDPCAAAPAAGTGCYIPRLQEAAACVPCDPCAPCYPCDPCAPCDPFAPCDAATTCAVDNPSAADASGEPGMAANPCAVDPCAPCGPCGPCAPCGPAAEAPDVTEDELRAVYECIIEHMRSAYGDDWDSLSDFAEWPGLRTLHVAYADSGLPEAGAFPDWENVSTAPYASATHGDRFVTNHVNEAGAEAYRRYEEIGEMPVGGIVAKPSFTVAPDGEAQLGPLFLMEKMEPGFYEPSDDWKYSLVMPDGSIGGITQGQGSENVQMCIGCHMAAPEGSDSLLFLPERLRR
jgi:hypothetical protein